jgi:hypothetical protein
MAAKFISLTNKIAILLHLVVQSCTICSSGSRQPVRKLLVTPSYAIQQDKKSPDLMKSGGTQLSSQKSGTVY